MLTVVKRSIATVGHSYEGFLIDHFSCLQKNHNLLLLSSVNNHQYLFHLLICTIDPLITKKNINEKANIVWWLIFFFFNGYCNYKGTQKMRINKMNIDCIMLFLFFFSFICKKLSVLSYCCKLYSFVSHLFSATYE